jgi:hypothetical protein
MGFLSDLVRRGYSGRALTAAAALLVGCASPGPPKPPSLHLPRPANDLTAQRIGDTVELRLVAPMRSTDGLPLPAAALTVRVCRQLEHAACAPLPALTRSAMPSTATQPDAMTIVDPLPAPLTTGAPRLLGYRVTLANAAGRDAGPSPLAFTVAGAAPSPVAGLTAEGSRLGAVLRWQPAPPDAAPPSQVILTREDTTASKASGKGGKPARPVDLAANAADSQTLDTGVTPGVAYRYTAERRATVHLGGRTLELRSAASDGVMLTLALRYPPLPPTGLVAAGFATEANGTTPTGFAVDLNWQPVDEPGLLAGLAGYNVYREALSANGEPAGARGKLNQQIVAIPAFHDATAAAGTSYRYSVTAVDGSGNESAATTVVFPPQS